MELNWIKVLIWELFQNGTHICYNIYCKQLQLLSFLWTGSGSQPLFYWLFGNKCKFSCSTRPLGINPKILWNPLSLYRKTLIGINFQPFLFDAEVG